MNVSRALAGARPESLWLDNPARPAARPKLAGNLRCDLAVVGGGLSGLWTALLAKQADPDRDVLLLEGGRIGWAASGRNGGFCASSLTHGEANGRERFAEEYDRLDALGRENLDAIARTVEQYEIDCDFRRSGELTVATEPYQVAALRQLNGEFLDQTATRQQVASPTFLASLWTRDRTALLDPARLVWGLAAAAEQLGVRIVEGTPVRRIGDEGARLDLYTDGGIVRAERVALGTSAFRPLLRRLRLSIVPVWDYVLATEPLTDHQLDALGWRNRQGLSDTGNQFHYYRLTADNRIVWGGYDAVYYYGRSMRPGHRDRPRTYARLAEHFALTFPQLDGIRFTHAWGGAIDTCTRFCAFFGTSYRGRLAYVLGYTGLGVGASRFGAQVMLDLLSGQSTELTELRMVRSTPLPFPPEPFAFAGIQATRWSLARADRNAGRRNLWLRTLDRIGLGFDS
ncbi:MAG: FAD-dependent oxidoreductase [Actinobacteria bacterium]|nr:FAD-dependent oxidoreductase [Actinomycetota bacterium]